MKNFFFAPSKATENANEMLDYLNTLGHVRVAEPDSKKNREWLRRLKVSEERPGVDFAICVITSPTCNSLINETEMHVGRGIFDICNEALLLHVPTFLLLEKAPGVWLFYPVLHCFTSEAGNWKTNYGELILELPVHVEGIVDFLKKIKRVTEPEEEVPF